MIDPQINEVTQANGAGEIRVEQDGRVRAFIQSHPLMVVLGALALGFSVARWMREH